MWNPKIFNTDHVLYAALADAIERDICLGVLKPGDRMPPQRSLAELIGVNLTTITRAYREAEKRGLIAGTVGKGTFVLPERGEGRLPEVISGKGAALIEMGLVGAVRTEGHDLAALLRRMAVTEELEDLFDYGPSQGGRRHREVAAHWMAQYGLEADPDRVVLCGGSMHGIHCCLLGHFEPGDRIAVDALTFTGFKNAAQLSHLRLEPVAMDDEGMIPESLEALCKRVSIKGIYLMPSMQNPTSATMSEGRKKAIAEVIMRYDLILMEDDIYNFAAGADKTALSALVPDHGLFICGISKALFPGLRIAFLHGPRRLLSKITQAVASTMWMASPLNAEMVTQMIESGEAAAVIAAKNALITRRLRMAKGMLEGFSYRAAERSLYLWLELPEGWTASEFERQALLNQVRVIGAGKFQVGGQSPPAAVRIALGSVGSDEQMIRGLSILVKLLKEGPQEEAPCM